MCAILVFKNRFRSKAEKTQYPPSLIIKIKFVFLIKSEVEKKKKK